MSLQDRFRGCLIGLAVGDAVGTTLEFRPRGSFDPITDMVGRGPFGLKPGQWTDDTSLALCLAASLVEVGADNARDQLERYCRWHEQGYMSSTGRCFDIGTATASALRTYRRTGDPRSGSEDPRSAGNGSIMRLAPVPMFCYPDLDEVERVSGESSRTTHGAPECVDACRLLGRILCRALLGRTKEETLLGDRGSFVGTPKIAAIAEGAWIGKDRDWIIGSGYVVESLEAALWCFAGTATYRDAVLEAANLGDDADTTAAICGQVAGAYYGAEAIPSRWRELLTMRDEIEGLADTLHARHVIGS
ncbi:MAG: ADP-ribosylglycohydrolase family protein [Armatimonadetes bacterium]|nr:ADP-ribosylglycohydrolase family protein [Armatimonadota bacterium]